MGIGMIDHLGITVRDINKSRIFYSKLLAALGYVLITDGPTSVGFGVPGGHDGHDVYGKSTDPGGDFWISTGAPTGPNRVSPVHFAFSAVSQTAVSDFYTAGILAGGIDNGAPGIRPQYHPNYYAAFLLDPDGYNIEAVCHRAPEQAPG